ncbi:hypothetical protein ACJJIK_02075 [Microbulbifer sp. ZKSA006]|uniref:hypothetical protein n=1 Tax=Microbulbifer sp. ZKSA006 TaxID=3243390 RepID=UPI004039EC61
MLASTIEKKEYGDPDLLLIEATLKIEGRVEKLSGTSIDSFHADLEVYGFKGSLSFSYDVDFKQDTLIESFSSEAPIWIDISIIPVFKFGSKVEPIKIKGLVTEKSVAERRNEVLEGQPVLVRNYTVNFSDPAFVLWKQHFPCELYTNKSMRKVIEQQLFGILSVDFKYEKLAEVLPMITLGLGLTYPYQCQSTGGFHSVSFYDFLMSYIDSIFGVWLYDYSTHTYKISDHKPEPRSSKAFLPNEVTALRSYWPETPRHNLQMLNGIAIGSDRKLFNVPTSLKGVRKDFLYREPLKKKFDELKKVDEKRFKEHGVELHGAFSQWPLETYFPGCEFSVEPKAWGQNLLYSGRKYCCYRVKISAEQTDGSRKKAEITDNATYRLSYTFYAEQAESPKIHMPDIQTPSSSFYVEGKVVSGIGSNSELTYDLQKNKNTEQFEYQVYIPLFDQTIRVLFETDNANPHLYFPLYRDTRVLVAMDLYQAVIVRVLDWGRHSRLTPDTQGNHLLFGKNDTDQTSVKHIYQQGKPELHIKRTKGKDTELLQMKEGTLILQTCEE